MASGTIPAAPRAVSGAMDITIPANVDQMNATFAFSGANKYRWVACQYSNSSANMYTGVFVNGVIATASGVQVFVDRQLRNNNTSPITVKIWLIGVNDA